MENSYYENLNLVEESDWNGLLEEFEDTGDPVKPFRTEYAFEGLTEKNSRFRRRGTDY